MTLDPRVWAQMRHDLAARRVVEQSMAREADEGMPELRYGYDGVWNNQQKVAIN
jgi:hypothetical protein